eukprot:CAMPEP_0173418624 /NCGR_PEP_ID=MMETSP1357-20121228/716_1 /TAXON_ID=77926 /ORGANISM="Hemiselmis rufescens, Strain PCC563" /LENGTH=144 /DNA_ID=CAMNT_0014381141 /DNA_START=63 /DNA_END=497 /DNA_ORIENTATION=-
MARGPLHYLYLVLGPLIFLEDVYVLVTPDGCSRVAGSKFGPTTSGFACNYASDLYFRMGWIQCAAAAAASFYLAFVGAPRAHLLAAASPLWCLFMALPVMAAQGYSMSGMPMDPSPQVGGMVVALATVAAFLLTSDEPKVKSNK